MTTTARRPIRLTGGRAAIAVALWSIRRTTGISPEGLAARLGLSRSGIYKRETDGRIPTAGLIDHVQALGWTVALVPPPRPRTRPTGTGWPA